MRTVPFKPCESTGKRGFPTREQARKALGKARTKRHRKAAKTGIHKGLRVESRAYECADCGHWHLTHQSQQMYASHAYA